MVPLFLVYYAEYAINQVATSCPEADGKKGPRASTRPTLRCAALLRRHDLSHPSNDVSFASLRLTAKLPDRSPFLKVGLSAPQFFASHPSILCSPPLPPTFRPPSISKIVRDVAAAEANLARRGVSDRQLYRCGLDGGVVILIRTVPPPQRDLQLRAVRVRCVCNRAVGGLSWRRRIWLATVE